MERKEYACLFTGDQENRRNLFWVLKLDSALIIASAPRFDKLRVEREE
jgi:hypothetical protein